MVTPAPPVAGGHQSPSTANLQKSQKDHHQQRHRQEQQKQHKQQTQRCSSGLLRPPLLRLPPEIILRIISFVARLGVPSDLARLRATSTTFYFLLNDTGRSIEQTIWRGAATALLGAYTPRTLTLEPSWQEFVKRTWRISKSSKAIVGHDNDEKCPIRRFKETNQLFTTNDGPFPQPSALSWGDVERAPELQVSLLCPGPIPDGARRVIDFVHSGTEGSRGVSESGFCGADAGAFFTYTIDPRHWLHLGDRLSLNKGFVLGGRAGDKRDAMPVIANVMDVSDTVIRLSDEESLVEPHGFGEWARSCVHSDANLCLVPKLMKLARTEVGMVEVVIRRVVRYSAPGVVDKLWDLEDMTWEGTHLTARSEAHGLPWTNGSNWEFRSAGDFLVICDDNNSRGASTITCFASGKCRTPLWQRTMDGQIADNLGRPHPFFYDNDGIRMNSALVAYACRLKASASDPRDVTVNRNVMEFILLSTETGRTLRVLSIPQEDRPQKREGAVGLCAWCSFSLSESVLVATLGGRTPSTAAYHFFEAFVWDLTMPYSLSSSPTYTIHLPEIWELQEQSWTALSPDGRWLGIQAGWDIGVWDLETRSQVGIWRMAKAEKYERSPVLDPRDSVYGWSSLWVKYRDIYDHDAAPAPPTNIGQEEQDRSKESLPASSHVATTEPPGRIVHGVACYTSRVLRKIFQRTETRHTLGGDHQWNEYPESIFSSADVFSDDSSEEYLDDFGDDDDGGLSDIDYYDDDTGYFGGFDDDDDDDVYYDEELDGSDEDVNEGLDPDGGAQEEVVDESSVDSTGTAESTRGDGNTNSGSATPPVADLDEVPDHDDNPATVQDGEADHCNYDDGDDEVDLGDYDDYDDEVDLGDHDDGDDEGDDGFNYW